MLINLKEISKKRPYHWLLITACCLLSFYSLNLFYISLRAISNLFPADKPSICSFLANKTFASYSFEFYNYFWRIFLAYWDSNFLNIILGVWFFCTLQMKLGNPAIFSVYFLLFGHLWFVAKINKNFRQRKHVWHENTNGFQLFWPVGTQWVKTWQFLLLNISPDDLVVSNLVPDDLVVSNLVPDDLIVSNLAPEELAVTNLAPDDLVVSVEPCLLVLIQHGEVDHVILKRDWRDVAIIINHKNHDIFKHIDS